MSTCIWIKGITNQRTPLDENFSRLVFNIYIYFNFLKQRGPKKYSIIVVRKKYSLSLWGLALSNYCSISWKGNKWSFIPNVISFVYNERSVLEFTLLWILSKMHWKICSGTYFRERIGILLMLCSSEFWKYWYESS